MSETRITRILYMEDDPSLSVLLKKRFERRGYRVDIAADGEEGLRMAGASQYVSVGISLYPLDGDDVETLMKKADDAMYRVKKNAKGGFRFFSDDAGASSVSAP